MSMYRHRLIDPLLAKMLAELPGLLLVGPRATGKTTTALRHAASVIRLDRPAEAAAFRADPDVALRGLAEPVLLDEWQTVPEILGAVKRAIDANSRAGRYILTGSVRAELDVATWPGTGRLVRIPMCPLTVAETLDRRMTPFLDRIVEGAELRAAPDSPDLRGYVDLALAGGFPQAVLQLAPQARATWLEGYVEQLLTRDALTVEGGRDPARIRRYFEAYVLSSAGTADHKTIYDAAGINRKTAVAYERLLQNLMVVDHLPAWSTNRLKRLVRAPKRYVIDPSLFGATIGVDSDAVLRDGDLLGRLLDTFVVAQLRVDSTIAAGRPRLYHVRQEQGRHEVDVVVELAGSRVAGIEVKSKSAPSRSDARHLVWLRDYLRARFVAGVVLHTGPSTYALDDRILAAPISTLWASD